MYPLFEAGRDFQQLKIDHSADGQPPLLSTQLTRSLRKPPLGQLSARFRWEPGSVVRQQFGIACHARVALKVQRGQNVFAGCVRTGSVLSVRDQIKAR